MEIINTQSDRHVLTRRDALRTLALGTAAIVGWQTLAGCSAVIRSRTVSSSTAEGETNAPILSTSTNQQGEFTMSIRVQITSAVKQDKMADLMQFLEENLPNVRSFDGCLSVTVLMNKETGAMVLDEEWISVEKHQEYLRFIEANGILGQLASHFDGPPNIQYLDRILI